MIAWMKMFPFTILLMACVIPALCKEQMDMCDPKIVQCPCGHRGDRNATINVEMCSSSNYVSGLKFCTPCRDQHLDNYQCLNYENCHTCSDGINRCVNCDTTNNSTTCHERVIQKRSLQIYLAAGGDNSETMRHLSKRTKRCSVMIRALPNADIRCVDENDQTSCQVHCVWGSYFPGGRETFRMVMCNDTYPVWTPKFEDCILQVDCLVALKAAGAVHCVTHQLHEPDKCCIRCGKETPKYYNCLTSGGYEPPLPACVKLEREQKKGEIHHHHYYYNSSTSENTGKDKKLESPPGSKK